MKHQWANGRKTYILMALSLLLGLSIGFEIGRQYTIYQARNSMTDVLNEVDKMDEEEAAKKHPDSTY